MSRDVSSPLSTNQHLLRWVRKMADLARPEAIHWVDGSQEEYDLLCDRDGEKRNARPAQRRICGRAASTRDRIPTMSRASKSRTFVCSLSKDDAGPTNNWVNPFEMRGRLRQLFAGAMAGRTMYVLAFSMGTVGLRRCRGSPCS